MRISDTRGTTRRPRGSGARPPTIVATQSRSMRVIFRTATRGTRRRPATPTRGWDSRMNWGPPILPSLTTPTKIGTAAITRVTVTWTCAEEFAVAAALRLKVKWKSTEIRDILRTKDSAHLLPGRTDFLFYKICTVFFISERTFKKLFLILQSVIDSYNV